MALATQSCKVYVMALDNYCCRYVSPKVRTLIETLHSYKPNDNFVIVG